VYGMKALVCHFFVLGPYCITHHTSRALHIFLVPTRFAHSALSRTRSHIHIVTRNGPRSVFTGGTRQTKLFAYCVLFVPVRTTLACGESVEIIGVASNRAVSASICFCVLAWLTRSSIHRGDDEHLRYEQQREQQQKAQH
jgi:hypothetical protein